MSFLPSKKFPMYNTLLQCCISFFQRYGKFLLLCLVGFLTFFCSYMRIPVLPLFAVSLGAGPAQVGLINGVFMLTTGVLSIPGGLLADRFGRRQLAVGGILAAAVSSLLVAHCSTPSQVAAVYVLFGIALAAFVPSMLSQVADALPPERLGQAYGWYTTAVYAAITLGPASGGLFGKAVGLRQVFFLSGGMLLCVALFAGCILPQSELKARPSPRAVLGESFRLLGNRCLLAGLVASLGSAFGFGIFVSFLPLHAAAYGLDPAQVGFVFAAQALTNVFGRVPVGMALDRIPLPRIIAAGLFCFAFGLSAIGTADSVVSLSAWTVMLGGGMALTYTGVGALVAKAVPPVQRGLAMGMYNSSVYLGMMAGSTSLGPFVATYGYGRGFVIGGVLALVTARIFLQTVPKEGV